jgi:hypothetical protein
MRILLYLVLVFTSITASAQEKWALGPLVSYNFALKSQGIGFRATIPLTQKIILNPQVKYFPNINPIEELYAGLNVQYVLIGTQKERSYNKSEHIGGKPSLYVTAGVDYNNWLNYDPNAPTVNTKATNLNILPNIGLGTVIGGSKLRLFAEAKYNVLWNESFGEVGFLIYPSNFKRKNKSLACPAIK